MATTQDEVLLKVGVDGSKIQSGMTDVSMKLSRASQNLIRQSERVGERSGIHFGKGFGSALLGRLGLGVLIGGVLMKAREMFADTSLGKQWDQLWNANRYAKEAGATVIETERKVAEFEKKKKERRADEIKASEDVRSTWLDRQNTQTQLLFALEKEQQLMTIIRGHHGSNLEKLKLQKELEEARNTIAEKRNALEKDFTAKKEKQKDIAQKIGDIDAQIVAQRTAVGESRSSYQRGTLEGFMPSIEALAGAGWLRRGINLASSPFRFLARDILNLGDLATEQFGFGNIGGAQKSIASRNRLYDQLADRGIIAQRKDRIDQATIDSEKHLAALVEQKATLLVQAKAAK